VPLGCLLVVIHHNKSQWWTSDADFKELRELTNFNACSGPRSTQAAFKKMQMEAFEVSKPDSIYISVAPSLTTFARASGHGFRTQPACAA
jgi:hypothetical protein